MQPSPMDDTSKLLFPSLRFCMIAPVTNARAFYPSPEWEVTIVDENLIQSREA
jgi:hypothetical protein